MPDRRYCAFISYRHADNAQEGRRWAEWLHRALERYVVPPDLVGTPNLRGEPVPASLYPIFRDEDELPANARDGILPEEECFGHELRFGMAKPDGTLDWTARTEPLAADLRPGGLRAEGFVSAEAYREHLTLHSALPAERIAGRVVPDSSTHCTSAQHVRAGGRSRQVEFVNVTDGRKAKM